ncbi:MAG TPA: phage tail tape measure protein [Phycisphaerae bacterium]|nr:phage tail tape measure protein [Phycisphaerae bacterium]HUX02980.1 phage tail tape measure protein [Phycisphaerae bacterium]
MATPGGIRAGKAYVELGVRDRLSRGLRAASAKLKAFGAQVMAIGASVRTAGLRLFAAAAGMAVPFVVAAKVFASFEEQMANVSTMLGDQAEKYMPAYTKAVRRMSVEFGEGTETIAKGLYDLLSATVAPEKALGVLRVALKAAAGGMTDTATSVKAVVRVLKAYNVDAEAAADISDLLFKIVQRGVVTYPELAEHIGSVAPAARAAGLSLEELAAAIATVITVEEPARAMTALRQAIFEAAEAGLDLMSFIRKFEGADLEAIIAAGIPKRAALGVVILAGNIALLDENLAAMAARTGAAEEAYQRMAFTLGRFGRQAKQAGLLILSTIGEALAEPLKRAAKAITEWGTRVADWVSKNKELIRTLAKGVLIVGALGAGLVILGTIISGVGFGIMGFGIILGAVVTALGALLSPLGLVVAALGLVSIAVVGLGAYLLWASGAGGKALAWLSEKFGELKDFALKSFQGIKDALAAGDFRLAARVLWASLKVAWQKGTHWLETTWLDWKKSFLDTATDAFYGFLALWTQVRAKIATVAAEMKALFSTIGAVGAGLVKLKLHETVGRAAARREAAELKARRGRGEITPEEYAAGKTEIFERWKARRAEIVGETDKKLVDAEEDLQKTLLGIEDEKEKALIDAAEKAAAARRKHAAAHGKALAAAEKELADAEAAWETAVRDAAQARELAERPLWGEEEPPGAPPVPNIADLLKNIGEGVGEAVERTVRVRGTFSPFAAEALGLGDALTNAAKATAKNTKRLVDMAEDGGLVFE